MRRPGFVVAIALAFSLASTAAAQDIRQSEYTQTEQQHSENKYADRQTGMTLTCSQAEGGKTDAYKCQPARKLGIGERAWRWIFRAGRDPIAIFTFLLLGVGVWQVGIAQRTAHRQLRAYISPDFSSITDGSSLTPPSDVGVLRGAVVMKNTGQTPAYDVVTWAAIDVARVTEEKSFVIPTVLERASVSSMGPGATTNQRRTFRVLTPHEISEIETNKSAVYLYGRCRYRDIFGKFHRTDFKLKYSGEWPPKGTPVMTFCDDGNEAD